MSTPGDRELLFTKEEWDAAVPFVVKEMTEHLRAFRTPIFKNMGEYCDGWGTGSYLQIGKRVFVLTNEHVAKARSSNQLIHQFVGDETFQPVVGNHIAKCLPHDLALLPVNEKSWKIPNRKSKSIPLDRISPAHNPVPTEIMTFTGFSGQEAKFYFNTMNYTGTCYTSREVPLPQDERFSSQFHFGLDYRPDLATQVIGNKGLPVPPGLSGSTVWNTRFVETRIAGQEWKPDLAVVTGVVWGWPSGAGCLVATRAEYLQVFLREAAEFTHDSAD